MINDEAAVRQRATKVPEVTVWFWITKILTTGMGETTSDFLVHNMPPIVAVALGGVVLAFSLALQFRAPRYVAWIYWFTVVMVSIVGTMVADFLHVELKVPYAASTPFFAVVLAVTFIAWHRIERTLSIHSIRTPRREMFYWATVIATFALGTAAGDLTATTMHLGYFSSGVMFAVIIAIPALAHWRLGLNAIFAFWFAYIVTRPLGASFADWIAVSRHRGGLAWGDGPVSAGLTIVIACCVAYLATGHPDRPLHSRASPKQHPIPET